LFHLLYLFLFFSIFFFFFFNDPSTTEIYTLSLHDALPIFRYFWNVLLNHQNHCLHQPLFRLYLILAQHPSLLKIKMSLVFGRSRSEEHTSELQSRGHLVCRLLLEKKKNKKNTMITYSVDKK